MTLPLSGILLALVGLSLILIVLSLLSLRGTSQGMEPTSAPARFFLIVLRVAIGWHCLFEGLEKFNTANWSSEVYLRESIGPLSGFYRGIAGDRLVDKLTVGEDKAFPHALDREWRDYLAAFSAYYDLSKEQADRASGIVDQREKDTLAYLTSKSETVVKIAPFPPELKLNMTMNQRLEEYARLARRVHEIEESFPTTAKDVHKEWKNAKADLAKWRGELKKSLDGQTTEMKKALTDILTSEQKQKGPMPEPIAVPMSSWQMLEWSDLLVKWSLVVLGICLMLGLFSRCASLVTALLILSFYAAMPPLPGWPESARLEGHYVIINKTLIEAIALLALACLPTGRWAGLDGLCQMCCPFSSKTKGAQGLSAKSDSPSSHAAPTG